jgi:hypothetical protein
MKLQILHVPDCPNVAVLAARLDEILAGRSDVEVERRVVADQDEAAAAGMTGSPTLLVDGTDPFAVPGSSASVSCRLYVDETGAAVGSPSAAQLRAVLAGRRPPTHARDGLTLGGWRAAGTGGRQAVLPGALRGLHQAVLRHFLTNGEPPDRGWMQQQARSFGLDPGRRDPAVGRGRSGARGRGRCGGGGVSVLRRAERAPGASGRWAGGVGDVRDRCAGDPADA